MASESSALAYVSMEDYKRLEREYIKLQQNSSTHEKKPRGRPRKYQTTEDYLEASRASALQRYYKRKQDRSGIPDPPQLVIIPTT